MDELKLKYRIKTFIMQSGERYCLLIDRTTGTPLYYPNLYVTTQIRNNGKSVAAMESALGSINVFLSYCDEEGVGLEQRFIQRKFFTLAEIDGIRDRCQKRFKKERAATSTGPVLVSPKQKPKPSKPAKSATEYVRLTDIGKYSKWLAEILQSSPIDRKTSQQVAAMQEMMNSRRPKGKGRNQLKNEKGLDENQVDLLTELVRPGSKHNPFPDPAVQVRNRLIIFILLHLGKRGGELLNIRGRDIKGNEIVIARRADEKDDPILLYRLLRHMPAWVRLILVGDPSQLPPIGPGLVLHSLAGLASIPQTELTAVMRQTAESGIPKVAAAIRDHKVPHWTQYGGNEDAGVSFLSCTRSNMAETVKPATATRRYTTLPALLGEAQICPEESQEDRGINGGDPRSGEGSVYAAKAS